MRLVFARLYKRFINDVKENENSGFSLLGHFDYLEFEIITLDGGFDFTDYDQLIYDAMNKSKSGYELQSICLRDCETIDSSLLGKFLSPSLVIDDENLPFIVLTMADDYYNWKEETLFKLDDFRCDLSNHLSEYQKRLDAFMEDYHYVRPSDIIRMNAFQTLGCMDTVLLFRTNSLQAVQDFIISLKQSNQTATSYSIFGVSNKISKHSLLHPVKAGITSDHEVELSARIIFVNSANHEYELDRLESYLKANVTGDYLVTSLVGHHQYLFLFQKDFYRVLVEILDFKGVLNPFGENPFHISVCRTSLRFKNKKHNEQILCDDVDLYQGKDVPGVYDSQDTLSELEASFITLYNMWIKIGEDKLLRQSVYFEQSKRYADSVRNILVQHKCFFMALQVQGQQRLNPEIFGALVQPIKVLTQNINVYTYWLKYFYEKLGTDNADTPSLLVTANGLIEQHIHALQQIQKSLELLGSQMISMTHMQRNFLETRGLFQNEITATAKLSLGYIEYAAYIGKKLLSTEPDKFSNIDNKNIFPYAFFVSFENTDYRVEATKQFNFLHLLNLARSFAYNDIDVENPHYLIFISISQLSAFQAREVRFAITHECSHYFGWRDRELRAISVITMMSKWFASVLLPETLKDIEEFDGISDADRILNIQIKNCVIECEGEYLDEHSKQVEIVEKQLMAVATVMLREKFHGNLENAYTHYLKEAVREIFIEIASGKVSVKTHGIDFDLPVLVANCILTLKHKQIGLIRKWLSSKENEHHSRLAYQLVSKLVRSDDDLMREIIQNLKIQLNQHIHGSESTSNPYKSIELEKGILKRIERSNQEPIVFYSTSIKEIADVVCNVCSETYADLIAIRILKASVDEYIKYVRLWDEMDISEFWRLQIIKETVYSDDDKNNDFWEMIEEGTGSFQTYTPIITEYLRKTTDNDLLKEILEGDGYFYVQQTETAITTHPDIELLYLLSCFQKLHCSFARKLETKTDDSKN